MTNFKDLKPLENAPPPHPKLTGAVSRMARLPSMRAGTQLACIVRVSEDGYVPEGTTVRAQMGPHIFTADIVKESLQSVLDDPLVVQVSLGQTIFPEPT